MTLTCLLLQQLLLELLLLLLLLLPCCGRSAPTGDGIKVSATSLVSVQTGQSATLPCRLDPPQSAEALEIQWFRNDGENFHILVYKERRVVYAGQNTQYQGRVSLGTKDRGSGGLASGDVSLQLVNVTVKDAADYKCYVSGDQDYDHALITLAVYKSGGPALLSAVWRADNSVNVSCESGGWFPEPRLQWRNSNEVLTALSLKHSRDSSGLVSVHSWILVSSSSKMSCSVAVDGGEVKEASVYLEPSSKPGDQCSGGAAGWVLFTVLLIVLLVGLVLLWFKKRGKGQPLQGRGQSSDYRPGRKTTEVATVERKVKLLFDKETMEAADASIVQDFFENIKFARTENPNLTLSRDDCEVRQSEKTRSLTEVTCLTALTGTTGFTSGRHYWEVSMKDPGVEVKRSWWLGVTHRSMVPQWADPSVSEGFWFLSSLSQGFLLNTEPHEFLPVSFTPLTVGVYLDCDTGELSFYDVEKKHLIGSLTVDDGGKLYPLFNPGLGDKSSMRLKHRDKSDFLSTPGSVVNSAEVTEGADDDNRDKEQGKVSEETT